MPMTSLRTDAQEVRGFVVFAEGAVKRNQLQEKDLRQNLDEVLDGMHGVLLFMIELGKHTCDVAEEVQAFAEFRKNNLSEEESNSLLDSLNHLARISQYSYNMFWNQDSGPLRERYSDLINQGWQIWKDAFESVEGARWALMNNCEGLERDDPVYSDVAELIDELKQ